MKYFNRSGARSLLLALFVVAVSSGISFADDSAKSASLDQICELYLDYPMSADEIYHDKKVTMTVEVANVRKIPLLCAGFPEGSFTMDIFTKQGPVLECYCNPPTFVSVVDSTPPGSSLTVTGTYKSLTSSFSESEDEQEQCKVTMHSCTFK